MLMVGGCEQLPVSQARAGSTEAWDILFRRYQLPLYVYVCELVHHPQTSLDLVQETFINAARHLGSLRDDERFGSWLFGIAHQKVIQHWRSHSRQERLLDELARTIPPDPDDGPDELLIQQEQEAAFMKHLSNLPAPHRSVLLLHFVEDFSIDEIASITDTPPGTVKSRLHYAKRALRKLMEQTI
ncbi:MAG TPA: RNA polymerase sigma factor [Verrucomicrobiae bacterium]|jgi:RNA polymerase sigma-70 factor (ECF subfamily)|nr:RNA polymerase sigma factor [Verrucomicrobiae bacterium]